MRQTLKELLNLVFAFAVVCGVVALLGWLLTYEWRECRGVGHGVLYCIIHFGG